MASKACLSLLTQHCPINSIPGPGEWAQLNIDRGNKWCSDLSSKGSLGLLFLPGPEGPYPPKELMEGEGRKVQWKGNPPPGPGGGGFQGIMKFENRLATLMSTPKWSASTQIQIFKMIQSTVQLSKKEDSL